MAKTRNGNRTRKVKHQHAEKKNHCCEVTIHQLNHWYKEEFEKLGWMVLASHRGHVEKIMVYKHSIEHLKKALEHKLTHVHEKDRKDDLHIMWNNVCILMEHVNKDFP